MTLRERIEARRAELLSEFAIADETKEIPETYRNWRHLFRTLVPGPNGAHIAAQSPAYTIARIDRELAGIDADLALLDGVGGILVEDNLNARYPEPDAPQTVHATVLGRPAQ